MNPVLKNNLTSVLPKNKYNICISEFNYGYHLLNPEMIRNDNQINTFKSGIYCVIDSWNNFSYKYTDSVRYEINTLNKNTDLKIG